MQNNTFFEHSKPNNIFVFDELPSTNDYLKELLTKVKPLEPYTVIMAKNQTKGRGQRGNVWTSEPSQNLTASFLLSSLNLPISKQFLLTIVSSLAVYDTLVGIVPRNLRIKWPNDILISNKKVAGILVENKISKNNISNSIVGIGINIFQKDFPTEINQKTTSIIQQNEKANIELLDLVKTIQHNLKKYTEKLNTHEKELLELYNDRLFNKNITKQYIFEEKVVEGEVIQVEIDGLLQINIENKLYKVDLKGISYIL